MDINFNKNEDFNKLQVAQLKRKLLKVYLGGGENRIEKHKSKGKLTARERVDYLFDNDSNSIVGSYTLFPRRIVVNGRPVRGYVCGDLVVDTAHRALGPALFLVNAALAKCEEEDPTVLFGFPNDKSEPVLL